MELRRQLRETLERINAHYQVQLREATAALATELKKGLAIIATMEGMVMMHDPHNLESWRIMRRVPKKLGRPRTVRRRKPRRDLPSA